MIVIDNIFVYWKDTVNLRVALGNHITENIKVYKGAV